MDDQRCENTEPHMWHTHRIIVATRCVGMTRCGTVTHEPHTFDEDREVYCGGICDCGLGRKGVHGPGAHK